MRRTSHRGGSRAPERARRRRAAATVAGRAAGPRARPPRTRRPARRPAVHAEWGSVTGDRACSGSGCHNYRYSYSITTRPRAIWALEIFISGPGVQAPRRRRLHRRLRPGERHRQLPAVQGDHPVREVHDLGQGVGRRRLRPSDHEGWLTPSHFRLTAPPLSAGRRAQTTWCSQRTGAPSPAWRKVSARRPTACRAACRSRRAAWSRRAPP